MKHRIQHKSKFLGVALKTLGIDNPETITRMYNRIIEESSSIYRKINEDSSDDSSENDYDNDSENSDNSKMSDSSSSESEDETLVNKTSNKKFIKSKVQPNSKNRFAAFNPDI